MASGKIPVRRLNYREFRFGKHHIDSLERCRSATRGPSSKISPELESVIKRLPLTNVARWLYFMGFLEKGTKYPLAA